MTIDQYFLLCLFVIALVGTPGPANLSLLAFGTRFGAVKTLPFLIGTLAGFQMIFFANAIGLLGLVIQHPTLWTALRFACFLYILYLAWMIVKSPAAPRSLNATPNLWKDFWRGFWIHPLNPKAYAMQVAAISQFIPSNNRVEGAVIVGLTFLILGGGLNFIWAVGGEFLAHLTQNPAKLRIISMILAALMVASTFISLMMS